MTRRVKGLLLVAVTLLLPAQPGCAANRRRAAEEAAKLRTGTQLYQKAMEEFSHQRFRKAREYLERIQFTDEERSTLEPLVRLALADVAFYAGDDLQIIEARSKYVDFVTVFGDHPLAPYAQFQAGICGLKQVRDPSRDQSETKVAIGDLRDAVRRFPGSPHGLAAALMLDVAERNLAESEYRVGVFYRKRRAYLAAIERFRGLLEKYPRFPEREKVYLELGRTLLLQGNEAEGKIYLGKLVADLPASRWGREAQKLLSKAAAPRKGSDQRRRLERTVTDDAKSG